MLKRLIFDIDGTVITGVSFKSSAKAALKRVGLFSEVNVEQFLKAISTYESEHNNYNEKDYTEHIKKSMNIELPRDFLHIFFDELKTCVPPYSLVLVNHFTELSKRYELVLLTNYFRESQLNRLKTMGLVNLFQACYGEELIKPNKGVYLEACGDNDPNECVMIGDDLYLDIEVPASLGLKTIFVNSKKIPMENKNLNVVDSVEDITTELLEKLN